MFEEASTHTHIILPQGKIDYILNWSLKLKAIYISQLEFFNLDTKKDLDLSDKVAISIVTHYRDKFPIKGNWKDTIQLVFLDSDTEVGCITDTQAQELYDFIVKNEGSNFVVHCLAGISRSAATAIFINELYEKHFITNYSLYNKIVYSKLRKCMLKDQFGE